MGDPKDVVEDWSWLEDLDWSGIVRLVKDLCRRRDNLRTEIERLREALEGIQDNSSGIDYIHEIATEALEG